MNPELPPGFQAECSDRSAQVIFVESAKAVLALVTPVTICAVIAAISMAITFAATWYYAQEKSETTAKVRVLQNHVDENTNELKRLCDKLGDEKCRQRIKEYEDARR